MPNVGDTIKDFVLQDQDNNDVNTADYKGKKLLLSFHPLAFTPICADQMKALEANYATLEEANTVPLGMSIDHAYSKAAWSKELGLEKLRLLADFWPTAEVSKELGLFIDKFGFTERANILVDENRKVVWAKVYPIKELPDIDEVLAEVKK